MYVERLMANLISISQICDLNFNVNFTRDKCVIFDECGKSVLEGYRSKDNCYTLIKSHSYNKTSINESNIWHEKLGHLNFKMLQTLANSDAVRGLPKLGKKS